jgi:RNA polymerase sigma-70 factor (ECF subfamily)
MRINSEDRNVDEELTALRRYAFSIAYRMLGSVEEAEDSVQDVYERIMRAQPQEVTAKRAYIATLITRACIDRLRAQARAREQYPGPWLPEPLIGARDPAEDADSLSLAFMVVLESLSPVERAVFLLREVFDYEHREIAHIVRKSEQNVRQIAHRARAAVAERRPRFRVPEEKKREIGERFVDALRRLDLETMMSLLADDATVYTDGGGKARAAVRPIVGAEKVSRFLAAISESGFLATEMSVNGEPGLVVSVDGTVIAAIAHDVRDERISAIFIITNPEKLTRIRV